jgi:UDP-3-O-[3-hydroxymyristoyl] glucosamine N-acyltransferase
MHQQGYFVRELADLLAIKFAGNPDLLITGISTLDKANENQIAFLFEEKYFKDLERTRASCLLVNQKFPLDQKFTYLVSDNPKLTMAKLLKLFSYEYENFKGIHPLAFQSDNISFGSEVSINPFVYLGKNLKIGNKVTIFPGCFIGDNSEIGDETVLYPNVTILSDSKIGNKVIIHSGTVIGSDGYGFIQLAGNFHHKVPQIGNVIIEDDVEIGSNASIDRATIGSTRICQGAKIDNQVHIAHNVIIGERSLIVAQVGIAGSTKIGANVILAGQAGVAGHLEIGDETLVLGRSGVTKSFPPKSKVSGFPARDHKEEIKNRLLIKKIPELIEQIEKLNQKIEQLELNNKSQILS